MLKNLQMTLLSIAVFPILLASLVFGIYLYNTLSDNAEAELRSRGQEGVNYISRFAALHIYAGNLTELSAWAEQSMSVPRVISTSFYDAQGILLLSVGKEFQPTLKAVRPCHAEREVVHQGRWYFCSPIYNDFPSIDVLQVKEMVSKQVVGWLVLGMETESLNAFKRKIIFQSIFFIIVVLIVTSFIASRLALNILTPIKQLVARVSNNNENSLDQIMDINEFEVLRERLENMLSLSKQYTTQLESQVAQSTAELRRLNKDLISRNKMLLNVQKQLESAAKSKDAFLARISHELRTPLTTINGYTHLLTTISSSDLEREYVKNIASSSQSLMHLIEDILTMAKINEGKFTTQNDIVEFSTLLEDVVTQHVYNAANKNLEMIVVESADFPSRINIDGLRLKQILNNLMSNAVKFSDAGSVILSCSMEVANKSQVVLVFDVVDTGIGIDKDKIEALFEPFTQADESISRRFGGTGLGLSISRQLAELLNGSLTLSSNPDKGTKATLKLFMSRADIVAAEDPVLISGSILVIEPNPQTRNSYRRLFSLNSREFYLQDSVSKGCEILAKQPVDLVFIGFACDISIDDVNEAVDDIRQFYDGKLLLLMPMGILNEQSIISLNERDPLMQLVSKPLLRSKLRKFLANAQPEIIEPIVQFNYLKVVVVEDQPFLRDMFAALLKHFGVSVEVFADGKAAINYFSDHSADLIFSDLHMPNMNGLDLYKGLQKLLVDKMPPFYIVTADSSDAIVNTLEHFNIAGMLFKPINPEKLVSILQKYGPQTLAKANVTDGILTGFFKVERLQQELLLLIDSLIIHHRAKDWVAFGADLHKIKGLISMTTAGALKQDYLLVSNLFQEKNYKPLPEVLKSFKKNIVDLNKQ